MNIKSLSWILKIVKNHHFRLVWLSNSFATGELLKSTFQYVSNTLYHHLPPPLLRILNKCFQSALFKKRFLGFTFLLRQCDETTLLKNWKFHLVKLFCIFAFHVRTSIFSYQPTKLLTLAVKVWWNNYKHKSYGWKKRCTIHKTLLTSNLISIQSLIGRFDSSVFTIGIFIFDLFGFLLIFFRQTQNLKKVFT